MKMHFIESLPHQVKVVFLLFLSISDHFHTAPKSSLKISYRTKFTFSFSHLADAFIQSDLHMRTVEAIKINKSYNKSPLA